MNSAEDVVRFMELFKGNERAYGVTQIVGENNGKVEGQSHLEYNPVTPTVMLNHLAGTESIGIAPINDDSCCYFGAIDIDNYEYNLNDVIASIYRDGFPLVPCWSKSKKLHLYIFFSEEVPANEVKELLGWYRDAFACDKKTEIFPKQSKTTDTHSFYSWINLPYFHSDDRDNWRKMINPDGSLATLEEFMARAEQCKLTLEEHKAKIKAYRYWDAPPCLLSGLLLRDIGPGFRNNWLFSVGVYLRLKDENCDLDTLLTEVNNELHEPIAENELRATILSGLKKKSYFYQCAQLNRCNKVNCRKLAFGIESNQSTGLDYGSLTQVMTDPPYYEWTVNGQKMMFWSETEILMQTKFRALCLRQLHLVPRRVKDERWSDIVTRACEHIEVVYPTIAEGDFTAGSTFLDLVYTFFNGRRRAENMTQLSMGRVYLDDVDNEFVFTAKSFIEFITKKNDFKQLSNVEMRVRLQQLGAHKEGLYWRIPAASIPDVTNKKEIDIDFRDKETGQEDF